MAALPPFDQVFREIRRVLRQANLPWMVLPHILHPNDVLKRAPLGWFPTCGSGPRFGSGSYWESRLWLGRPDFTCVDRCDLG